MKIPAALYEPDKSRYNMGASNSILNALPVADGWAPMPSANRFLPAINILLDEDGAALVDEDGAYLFELVSGGTLSGELFLPEEPKGCVFVRLPSGTVEIFVGTETRLWKFNKTDYSWEDVSGPSAPYAASDRWSFALYGDVLYAQNGADPEQKIEVGVDSTFSDNSSAPIASYIAVVADFMFRARLASDANSIQWSALDDPQSNTIGDKSSDVQPFGEGNGVQGIIPVSSGAVVFLKDAVEILRYPDPDFIFRRSPLTLFRGAMAPGSICAIGQDDFVFYAADGFFRGMNMQPIGAERVDRTILALTDETARKNMISAPDFRRKIVWFLFQTTQGARMCLGYHWQLDRWAAANPNVVDMLRAETFGVTIDGLANLFATIDDINVPFSSSLFDGGSIEFAGIDQDGALVYFNGEPMEALLQTNEASLNGTDRAMVNGGRIDGDIANFTAILSTADYKNSQLTPRNAVTPSTRTRFVPFRGDGRVHKVAVTIPQGEPWTIFQGIDVDVVGTGKS